MVIFVVFMDFGWYLFMLFRCFRVFTDKAMDLASLSRIRAPVTVRNSPLLVFTGSAPPTNHLLSLVVEIDEGIHPLNPTRRFGVMKGMG